MSKAKKYWFTIAYFTREGNPHPAHAHSNFTQVYGQLAVHLDTLQRVMKSEILRRGAHVAAIWAGRLSEHEALHGPQKPLYHVFEGGKERV